MMSYEKFDSSVDSISWLNNPAKFYLDPIWNDGALSLLSRASPQKEQEEEQQQYEFLIQKYVYTIIASKTTLLENHPCILTEC